MATAELAYIQNIMGIGDGGSTLYNVKEHTSNERAVEVAGLDLAKRRLHVYGVNEHGQRVIIQTFSRTRLDHSHAFTIAGSPKRGNPILGKAVNPGQTDFATAADGMPYTTVSYANGLGHHVLAASGLATRSITRVSKLVIYRANPSTRHRIPGAGEMETNESIAWLKHAMAAPGFEHYAH
ncbi:MAG TPA: hypothetical protein PK820_00750 [Candidatus Competibacteraceae bacterium]|nr:hypothetical protein [Candidatus Competibacteraceae bacterium]